MLKAIRISRDWVRMAEQVQMDFKLWLICVMTLTVFRAVLMAMFHSQMGARTGAAQVLLAFAGGFRFDAQTAALFVALPFLFSLCSGLADVTQAARLLRNLAALLFIFSTLLLGIIDLGFFREYDDQFNHFILGVVYDDMGAILLTLWKEYPMVWMTLGMFLLDGALFWAARRFYRKPWLDAGRLRRFPSALKWTLGIAVLLCFLFAARGSLGTRPIQQKDIGITADAFLNKCVLNPPRALWYAIQDHMRLASPDGIKRFIPSGDVGEALRRIFPGADAASGLDACLQRPAHGTKRPPKHVFLIVLESYSGWPLFEPYRALGIATRMERLGGEGILVKHFLPDGTGTMTTLGPLLTGLADPGIPINYQPGARAPFPTGLAAAFSRMGYRTRFFYGGYLSWQRLGDFAKDQGFQEVYGGGDMGSWARTNEWGVRDEDLYAFALKQVAPDPPSFNIILTVSNHPPFDVDAYGKGFPLKAMPSVLAASWDGKYTLDQIGQFWYADQCLGGFADTARTRFPGMLLAATADHYGRRFLNSKPGLPERAFVPLLLFGPGILEEASMPPDLFGSHLDLVPTLVERCAPQGFIYPAMGRDVLGPPHPSYGFGADYAVGSGFVADLNAGTWAPWPDGGAPVPPPDLSSLKRIALDLKALSWWRVVRGDALPASVRR